MFPKNFKPNMTWFLWGAAILTAFGLGWIFLAPSEPNLLDKHTKTSFSEIQNLIVNNPQSVKTLTFLKERRIDTPVQVMTDGDKALWAEVPGTHDYELLSESAEKYAVLKDAKYLHPEESESSWKTWLPELANIVLPIAAFGVFIYMMRRNVGGGAQGEKLGKINLTRLDQSDKPVKFADVAGIEDELEKIRDLVFDIKQPQLLKKLGGNLPVGLQLVGPPGTGKTFIVQAIAGEAGIPVLTCAGSDFVEMYVGVGAKRMRSAWQQARELRDQLDSWVILFCDEFDAVGKSRAGSGAAGGGSDEREQTVGQILVEVQGTQSDNSRILFVIATNQPDVLDPAIIRSGRLGDMKVEVTAPDKEGRLAILNVKLRKIPAGDDVDAMTIAAEMPGLTGADIDTLVTKKGPAFAKRRLLERVPKDLVLKPDGFKLEDYFKDEDYKVVHTDLWKALEEMTLGAIAETKGRRLDPKIRLLIAKHELGHFTLAYRKLLQNTGEWGGQYGDKISAISILGPSGVGGFVKTTPEHDFKTAKNYKGVLAIMLAGNRAERMLCGDKTVGCENDLEQANRIVKAMLLKLNMSDCNNKGWKLPAISVDFSGATRYLGGQSSHAAQYGMSNRSAQQVDKFIDLFLNEAEAEADAYLQEERDWIEWMAPRLVQQERMRFPQIKAYWDEFHVGTRADLTRAVAFPYTWDQNHRGLKPVEVKPLQKGD